MIILVLRNNRERTVKHKNAECKRFVDQWPGSAKCGCSWRKVKEAWHSKGSIKRLTKTSPAVASLVCIHAACTNAATGWVWKTSSLVVSANDFSSSGLHASLADRPGICLRLACTSGRLNKFWHSSVMYSCEQSKSANFWEPSTFLISPFPGSPEAVPECGHAAWNRLLLEFSPSIRRRLGPQLGPGN